MIYLIGAGGIGGFLAPGLCKMVPNPSSIGLFDGDMVEAKNLSRQMYGRDDIGKPKTNVLSSKFGFTPFPFWFTETSNIEKKSVLFCAADNIPCRKDTLAVADRNDCVAIIGGNETWSSEAYIYFPQWQGTAYDPRTYYPTILTDDSGRPNASCHADATIAQNPQTITANMTAAALMVRLFFCWLTDRNKLVASHNDGKTRPVHLRSEKYIMTEMLTKASNKGKSK